MTGAAAVLVLGFMGSVGFAAVVTGTNRDLAKQTQRAEAREQMAINAVDASAMSSSKNRCSRTIPRSRKLRKKLLKEPLAFFKLLREQFQIDSETRPDGLARLAEAAHDYAHLTEEIGDFKDGLRSHVESLAIWEKLVRDHPAKTDYQQRLATIENCRGNMLSHTGHTDRALESYGKALAIHERLVREPRRHRVSEQLGR